jgi:peptide/nickel transport system permease protein
MFYAQTQRSNWWGFIGKRVFITVIAFFVLTLVIFTAIYVLPPFAPEISMSPIVNFTEMKAFSHEVGLDLPLPVQYFRWLGQIFTGDWGHSWVNYAIAYSQ